MESSRINPQTNIHEESNVQPSEVGGGQQLHPSFSQDRSRPPSLFDRRTVSGWYPYKPFFFKQSFSLKVSLELFLLFYLIL